MENILPLTIGDETVSPYAGFWRRTGSLLIDMLILMPYAVVSYNLEKSNYFLLFFTFIFGMAFSFFWSIYLLKRFGGTPGKLICGIMVLRKDGTPVGWKEALLRNLVEYPYGIYSSLFNLWMINQLGYDVFQSLSFMDFAMASAKNTPAFQDIITIAFQVWVWGELLVLLSNKRKRSIHDFIAGTVVVKKKILPQIRKHIGLSA